jgi:hypothetical protein
VTTGATNTGCSSENVLAVVCVGYDGSVWIV